jgi:shikimate dehydrogenase
MSFTGHAKLAGIMGWPVGHSRSPALHNFWLEENGIDGVYVPLAVRPERLEQALRALPALGFRGCNLTIPHKQTALAIVDRIEPVARRIGAINTIIVGENGSIEGSNTDAYGFREHLRESAPGWNAAAGPAMVLGAGGAARAVVAALIAAGVPEVRLVNRTRGHAETLAGDLQEGSVRLSVSDWDSRSRALRDAGILVNTTSLGMDGQPGLDLDLGGLPPEGVVVDIVYVPLETGLLAAARARGHVAVEGLGMLLHQGRPGFEAWFGAPVQVTPGLRAAMLATLAPPR